MFTSKLYAAFCKFRNNVSCNKPQATQSGGGDVRAAWRIRIKIRYFVNTWLQSRLHKQKKRIGTNILIINANKSVLLKKTRNSETLVFFKQNVGSAELPKG